MKRREIREHIFRMLFCKDFHDESELKEQIDYYFESIVDPTQEELRIIRERFEKVVSKEDEIDVLLAKTSTGWKISRMGKVDLTILRLAVFEMIYDDEIPVKVAINEAVELAKMFGGDETPGFVNGILAKFVKDENIAIGNKADEKISEDTTSEDEISEDNQVDQTEEE